MNNKIYICQKTGNIYWLDDGVLMACPIYSDNTCHFHYSEIGAVEDLDNTHIKKIIKILSTK